MTTDGNPPAQPGSLPAHASAEGELHTLWQRVVGRRSFLKGVGIAGAAALPASALGATTALAKGHRHDQITDGDVAILQFAAPAEIIETDLSQQHNELRATNGADY